MKKFYSLLLVLVLHSAAAQDTLNLSYYLPQDISYNQDIPKPIEVIGHEVGEWHVTHDKLVQYMHTLARVSDRITIQDRGKTFEGRPILLLTVTTPANHQRIEEIRREHLTLSDGNHSGAVAGMPVVVYQGFSIHGNEPSGANAGLAYAYYLAAAQGPKIEEMLSNMVILMDPSFNPDGLQRFAHWANTHRSIELNPDPNDREYSEAWPGGRTNHYWFDLNRDWLPVQLPESRARIKTFHSWMPNILTDHHEMGTNSTFFFQPGEPSRVHPLTPRVNQELTAEIATYHAEALDRIGSLYYSEENYDDYYYGKGSTFPDVNGCIGILFEQGSSRGHIQESENGILTFPFTIRNQFTTALSTIEAGHNIREKLLTYQKQYFANIKAEASRNRVKGFIFSDEKDPAKAWHLAEILNRHKIRIHRPKSDVNLGGKVFPKESSYLVPLNQKNPRLIQAMFEKRTRFTDSLFYDISAWTFPLAFDLDHGSLTSLASAGEELTELPKLSGGVDRKSNYAYLFEWHGYYAPKALNAILENGLRAKVAKSKFSIEGQAYDYGTIMIPVQNQEMKPDELYDFLQKIAGECALTVRGVNTGLAQGIDLGSNQFDPVKKTKVAVVVGSGVRSYDAGEIWHLFDTRYRMKITKLPSESLKSKDLSSYTDIIIPSSWGSGNFEKGTAEKLKAWVSSGGNLIAYRSMANWLDKQELMSITFKRDSLVAKNVSFENRGDFRGAQVTGGAIFQAVQDRSHPINFGFADDRISMFRNSNIYIEADKDSYNNPIRYTNAPLLSGYISEENLELLKNSVPVKIGRKGRGRIILFTDNTNFRAFWYGTNKLLMNAVFFGHIM